MEYIVTATVEGGPDSISSHEKDSVEEAYLEWVLELTEFFGFSEKDIDYIKDEEPSKFKSLSNLWEVSFVYGPKNLHCVVRIVGR